MFSGAMVLQGAVPPSRNWELESVRFQLGVPKQSECFSGMLSGPGMGGATNRQASIPKVVASRCTTAEVGTTMIGRNDTVMSLCNDNRNSTQIR